MEKFAALKRAKELDPHIPDGFWGADQPKCPHCGTVFDVSEHGAWNVYEEGEHELSCGDCDQDFTVQTRVSFSFDTSNADA